MEQVYGESRVTAKILKFNVIYSAVLHFSYIIKEPQDFWSHGHPLESRYGPNWIVVVEYQSLEYYRVCVN